MSNVLQQYTDLYRGHCELLEKGSPEAMNSLRPAALKSLEALGLPQKGSENYEISDIPEMLAPDYGINIARVPLDVDPTESFRCGVPHLSKSLFFLLNDRWAESSDGRSLLPEGVEIGPLSTWLEQESGRYGKLADIANPIVALNTLLVQEGMYLRIKSGTKLERPIQLVNILQSGIPMMTLRRLLIIVEDGAEGQLLICNHTAVRDLRMMEVSVAEVYVGRDSRFDIYEMEESTRDTSRLSALYLTQGEGSRTVVNSVTLYNGATRNEFYVNYEGENAECRLYGLGIENDCRVLDNFSYINHGAGRCHTDELFKYIVDDEARGAFTGRIYVAPGAVKTEAYQSNRNIVGSKGARMFSKPQLEIYNDDVKCSHGSATGTLDEMQVFYMRSRGLSDDEAKLLLKQAFMADIVNAVELPLLRDRLTMLIERRFQGEDIGCGSCEICK